MDSAIDYKMRQKNKAYYDYLSSSDQMVFTPLKKKEYTNINAKAQSFGSQKVDFSDFALVPDGYESITYSLYFLLVPYLVGNIFLFLVISGASFSNYQLLDTSAFLIVWIIGYEIVATVALSWIAVLFFKYDEDK